MSVEDERWVYEFIRDTKEIQVQRPDLWRKTRQRKGLAWDRGEIEAQLARTHI